jgi:hypothetical protein
MRSHGAIFGATGSYTPLSDRKEELGLTRRLQSVRTLSTTQFSILFA